MFSQWDSATESSSESSSQYIHSPTRAHYYMKFLWHSEEAFWNAHPQILALSYVIHCSCCSQIIVDGVKMCSCHLYCPQVLWHNASEFRCSSSMPGNLNITWNKWLLYTLPRKGPELNKRKGAQRSPAPQNIRIFFLHLYNIEILHKWTGRTFRHLIHQGGWPFWGKNN